MTKTTKHHDSTHVRTMFRRNGDSDSVSLLLHDDGTATVAVASWPSSVVVTDWTPKFSGGQVGSAALIQGF